MRRADRLFKIIQIIRRSRTTTAARIAAELSVSERTVYRDIRDLALSGVPILSEAGVGYALSPGYDLPPLMFTAEEISALVFGMRIVKARGDGEIARAADDVLTKVEHVLPKRLRAKLSDSALYAPFLPSVAAPKFMMRIRKSIEQKTKLEIAYVSEGGDETVRVIWPLAIFFWRTVWTAVAWCELRNDFRSFRIDRIQRLTIMESQFAAVPGHTLRDYFIAKENEFLS